MLSRRCAKRVQGGDAGESTLERGLRPGPAVHASMGRVSARKERRAWGRGGHASGGDRLRSGLLLGASMVASMWVGPSAENRRLCSPRVLVCFAAARSSCGTCGPCVCVCVSVPPPPPLLGRHSRGSAAAARGRAPRRGGTCKRRQEVRGARRGRAA